MTFFEKLTHYFQKYGMLIISGLLVFVIILVIVGWFSRSSGASNPAISGEQVRTLANKLFEYGLYPAAIEQYKHYLDFYTADTKEQANINYIMGNIYFDRLRDYEGALAHYTKVKYFYPESNLIPDVNKKTVACLERLQRTMDARQMLRETTSLDSNQAAPSRPGEVIAKFGNRQVTQGDLDFEISQLPPYLQAQFSTPAGKKQFLEQYISTELLYDTAVRADLAKDKEVIERTFQAKKQIMAQKYLELQIAEQVQIKPADVELYFQAHQADYAEKDKDGKIIKAKSLAEVQQQVVQDLARERQTKAYQELIERLNRTQAVQVYDDKIK